MKKYTAIIFLFFVSISFGQRKYAADKYFKEFAYVKSAELYEAIYKKGDSSKIVLSRLGDSYYLNSKTKESAYWYAKLFSIHDNIDSEYYFKYSNSLKSNGNYDESDVWLTKLKHFKNDDSRTLKLEKRKDYFKEYTKETNTFIGVHNLSINTKFSDYGVFMMNNKVLFASSRPKGVLKKNKIYGWNKQPFLNIYEAVENINNVGNKEKIAYADFKNVKLETNINTKYHEASAVVTRDGKTMYFTRDNFDGKTLKKDKNKIGHLKIYSAKLINGKWKNIKALSFNSDDYSTGHPALSLDETELYFVSDMPNGFGATDLYKATLINNNQFSKPVNLGAKINTEGKEMFPFISNENILYFSSNGHLGLGALDVFESKIKPTGYEVPVNLGEPINGKKDDFSFIVNKEKTRGYFSSNREGGKGDDDIYSFVINTKCEEILEGIVYNKSTQKVLAGANLNLIDKQGKIIDKRTSDSFGKFSFGKIECEFNYTVLAEKLDYKLDSKNILANDINKLALNLTPLIYETEIGVNPIRFDYDKSNIRGDAKVELDKIVSVMESHLDLIIKIESHTDSRGREDYNRKLSDRRAKSTRDYIISRGIKESRIESAIGYGEDKLLIKCGDKNSKKCTKENHHANRRSYFFIVSGKFVKTNNK